MKKCFFTFVSDSYYYPIGTPKLITSFKRFHPDIDLIVFRDDVINQMFAKYPWLNWLNSKPAFAKLLTDEYDLVVNIDADTVVTGRLESVLAGDYEVGSVTNFNDYENRHVEEVTDQMYLQAGLVASTSPVFWDMWLAENKEKASKYLCAENDTLNFVAYRNPWKLKIFDKDEGYMGCKSLGREGEFEVKDEQLWCRGERVYAYHHAKGPGALPKLVFENMGFKPEVVDYLNAISTKGVTEHYGQV